MEFFRFPHTPHLAWLASGAPRDDKVLSPQEVRDMLAHEVVIEEKVDGANVGLSVDEHGHLQAQNRGSYLTRERSHPQFKPLFHWLAVRRDALVDKLFPDLILFGEWCYATHSVRYTKLPDWFLAFDIYDRSRAEFWSSARRDELVRSLGLEVAPRLAKGRFDLGGIQRLLGLSELGDGLAEGVYVRRDSADRLVARAKLVRPEFVQSIEEHWSRSASRLNLLAGSVAAAH
jgi:ATP-dependent RNA circularization protein (DNA/RNA ligase family)